LDKDHRAGTCSGPSGGWTRAFQYVRTACAVCPDARTGSRAASSRGSVTVHPFFGLHFFVAALLAEIMRGNRSLQRYWPPSSATR
jgi:uncharacterized protein (DUF2062 family)